MNVVKKLIVAAAIAAAVLTTSACEPTDKTPGGERNPHPVKGQYFQVEGSQTILFCLVDDQAKILTCNWN